MPDSYVNGHPLSEWLAYQTNIATCDLLAWYTVNPPDWAMYHPIRTSTIGAYSLREDKK